MTSDSSDITYFFDNLDSWQNSKNWQALIETGEKALIKEGMNREVRSFELLIHGHLALAYFNLNRRDEGRKHGEICYAGQAKFDDVALLVDVLCATARAYYRDGKLERAIQILQDAEDRCEKADYPLLLKKIQDFSGENYYHLARNTMFKKMDKKATHLFIQAIHKYSLAGTEKNTHSIWSHIYIVESLYNQSLYEECDGWLQKARKFPLRQEEKEKLDDIEFYMRTYQLRIADVYNLWKSK